MRACLVFVALVATAVVGCRSAFPILGVGPLATEDPGIFDDALAAVRGEGYRPLSIEPELGRFEVVARADRTGQTHFVVQCFADGWVSILPTGGRVRRSEEGLEMPDGVENEYMRLADGMDEAMVSR